jgi:cytoskeleton protein RodZ
LSETLSDNQDFSANSPGTILKRCREFHRISIDEAAEATKIGANYLTALEKDSIREFANIAYLKGFLRIYSNYLGLNADDMIRLYERLYEPDGSHKTGQNGLAGDKATKRRKWFSWQKLAMPSVLLLLLVITAALLDRSQAPVPPPPQPQAAEQPPVQVAAVQPVLSSVSKIAPKQEIKEEAAPKVAAKKEEKIVEQKESPKAAAEVHKPFFVKMKVLQNSKLAVTIDGAATQSYDLNSGDIIEWKAGNSIALELSNSGGVEAELNGKPLKTFGPVGKPAYVVIGADGVKP